MQDVSYLTQQENRLLRRDSRPLVLVVCLPGLCTQCCMKTDGAWGIFDCVRGTDMLSSQSLYSESPFRERWVLMNEPSGNRLLTINSSWKSELCDLLQKKLIWIILLFKVRLSHNILGSCLLAIPKDSK